MPKHIEAPPTPPRWFNFEQACEYMQGFITPRQLRRAASNNLIGYRKAGQFVRFTRDDLDEYLRANTHAPRRSS